MDKGQLKNNSLILKAMISYHERHKYHSNSNDLEHYGTKSLHDVYHHSKFHTISLSQS